MEKPSLAAAYKSFADDVFPPRLEIAFYDEAGRKTLLAYEKLTWEVEGERKGLR